MRNQGDPSPGPSIIPLRSAITGTLLFHGNGEKEVRQGSVGRRRRRIDVVLRRTGQGAKYNGEGVDSERGVSPCRILDLVSQHRGARPSTRMCRFASDVCSQESVESWARPFPDRQALPFFPCLGGLVAPGQTPSRATSHASLHWVVNYGYQ